MSNWSDFQRKHIKPQDQRFVEVDGDPDFDLARHNKLIEDTITHNERVSRDKKREYNLGIEERAWAASKYIAQLKNGGEESVEKYFGKNYLNRLKGYEIAQKYKMAWSDAAKKKEAIKRLTDTHKSLT